MLRKVLSLLLSFTLLLGLTACGATPAPTQPETTAPPETTLPMETEPTIQALYDQARKPFDEAQFLTLNITTRTKYAVGQSEFEYNSVQDLQLANIGTDNIQVKLSEKITGEDFEDSFDEYFADGILYSNVYNQYLFQGAIEQADYLAMFAPAVLLDSALYGEVTESSISGGTLIKFSAPTGPESWAFPEGAEFQSANGTAFLNDLGALERTTYSITYSYGPATVTETTTVTPIAEASLALAAPANAADYRQIDWILGPRVYDLALAPLVALSGIHSASSAITETIVSEAAACVYTTMNTLDYQGSFSDLVCKVGYDVSVLSGGRTDTYSQEELYQNGAYTVTADGSEPQGADVTPEAMLEYAQQMLWENIISLRYFENVTFSEVGGLLYLELDFTEEFGTEMNKYVNTTLFNDEAYLDNLASAFTVSECGGYLALDPVTGFPTATGITFSGAHTVDGQDYAISLQTDQSFDMASLTAYETVTGESPAETEPETKATPLFYHVTGQEGQEMWLLGTIHVGDSRTAYLPQEIYDALDASDALAVEFDAIAFEENLETDSRLTQQLAAAYFYNDGTLTKDHLEEEVYGAAVKLLKASGNYNANAEYMQPYLWSQSIDNFYLKLGYDLVADKGVDHRLLTLAKESGKEIRDVESGLFQIQMFTGFSQELQALLLEESLDYTPAAYNEGTKELYELWCAGDEAALREELSDEVDTSELTEEELAEYEAQKHLIEEYNKAMSYDRNDGMLEVAVEYLESGDTVFYAVGLAHLLNNVNGLVDTLRDAGYTVELVTFE